MTPGEPVVVPSPAGDLEGFLDRPASGGEPRGLAVVCHPHPLYGGSASNKVVVSIARELADAAFLVLRFNFRGVGRSPGAFDGGRGEGEDVAAAVSRVVALGGQRRRPVLLAGFSFGAWVGLRVGQADARVGALLGVGIPLKTLDFSYLANARKPVLLIQGEADEFGTFSDLESAAVRFSPLCERVRIAGAGHFFHGRLAELRDAVRHGLEGPLALVAGGPGK